MKNFAGFVGDIYPYLIFGHLTLVLCLFFLSRFKQDRPDYIRGRLKIANTFIGLVSLFALVANIPTFFNFYFVNQSEEMMFYRRAMGDFFYLKLISEVLPILMGSFFLIRFVGGSFVLSGLILGLQYIAYLYPLWAVEVMPGWGPSAGWSYYWPAPLELAFLACVGGFYGWLVLSVFRK